LLIHSDDHGGVAGTLGTLEQFLARAHVLPRIKLPPQLSLRALCDLLDRLARVVAEAHRRVRRLRGGAIHAGFPVGVQCHLRRRRRDDDRIFQFQIKQLRREVDSRGIDGLAGNQIDPVECLAITTQIPFAAVAVRCVVVNRLRHIGEHHGLEIECAEHLAEAGSAPVRGKGPRVELGMQQRRTGDEPGQTCERFPARHRLFPLTLDPTHGNLPFLKLKRQLLVVALIGIGP
jgi:hypothetical protein